jgi:hypothetical protein
MDRVYSQQRFWCYEGNIRASQQNGRTALASLRLFTSYSHMKEKRSRKEWRHLIRAELKGKGRNRHCSATCPICLISYDVDILSNDASTHALAVGKVASHIDRAHADALTDCD